VKGDREEAFRPIGRWWRSEPASTDWRLLASLTQEYRPDPVYTASPRTAGPRYWQDGLVRSSGALLDVVSSCTQGTGCSCCAVTMITRSGGGGGGGGGEGHEDVRRSTARLVHGKQQEDRINSLVDL